MSLLTLSDTAVALALLTVEDGTPLGQVVFSHLPYCMSVGSEIAGRETKIREMESGSSRDG